jgi:hypothetical protein
MSSNGDAEKNESDVIDEQVELIMKTLSQKGDIIPELKALLENKE